MGAVVSLGYVGLAGAWGHLADVVLGRARALALAIAVAAVLLVVFALPLPFVAVGLAYMGFSMVCGLVFPLQDALAVNALPDPARQYGPVRGVESGAFAVATLVAGAGYGQLGYVAAVPLFAAARRAGHRSRRCGCRTSRGRSSPGGRAAGRSARRSPTQPRLPRLLLAIGLANVGVFAGLTFLPLLITRLGGGPGEIGLAVGITAAVEVVAMPVVSRLIASFGPRAVVVTSFVLLGVVFALVRPCAELAGAGGGRLGALRRRLVGHVDRLGHHDPGPAAADAAGIGPVAALADDRGRGGVHRQRGRRPAVGGSGTGGRVRDRRRLRGGGGDRGVVERAPGRRAGQRPGAAAASDRRASRRLRLGPLDTIAIPEMIRIVPPIRLAVTGSPRTRLPAAMPTTGSV